MEAVRIELGLKGLELANSKGLSVVMGLQDWLYGLWWGWLVLTVCSGCRLLEFWGGLPDLKTLDFHSSNFEYMSFGMNDCWL